jgi:single-stranded-DNA-specific exonuclease
MNYRWSLKKPGEENSISLIQSQNEINSILARLLIERNLLTPESINNFLSPKLDHMHDPFLMHDMEKGVNRLITALREGENILIHGDYDVDGITSVSLLYDVLFKLGGKVSFYIPNRITEGYGLSDYGIQFAVSKGINLIITADCGATANSEIKQAKDLGIDVIVCDHHEPAETNPEAYAILNPKQKECAYPYKELAGVGVAYKLLQGLYANLGYHSSELEPYLDLVAIGTAADIVPLLDENRVFVRYGLEIINSNPRHGIFALLESSSMLGKEVNVSSIVFVLAPRLNAVGRMSSAKKAVHLLTSSSLQQSRSIAKILESENKTRRDIDETTCQEALRLVEESIDLNNNKVLILAKKDWHPGVIGIVASRIMERFNRPTILISLKDGIGKGSARSTLNFDIYHALNSMRNLLDNFGGHKFAAGLTVREENIDLLREQMQKFSDRMINENDLTPTLEIESEISLRQLDAKFLKWLKLLAPYGPQNMRPIFVTRNIEILGDVGIMGNNHLKLKVKNDGIVIDAIAYNFGKLKNEIKPYGQKMDAAYVIEENTWNGQTTIQMRIRDLNLV